MRHHLAKSVPPLVAALLLSGAPAALAHAFPQKSQPPVGATVSRSPTEVRIWFNSYLSPLFDHLTVEDSSGTTVSGEAHVDAGDPSLLEAPVPMLPPGTYHVYWRVTSKDGHRTRGDYTFTVSSD